LNVVVMLADCEIILIGGDPAGERKAAVSQTLGQE
jgi:hypothetical protein